MANKMGWNYRVVYHPPYVTTIGGLDIPVEGIFTIHEAYYNKNGEVNMITKNPVVTGDEGDETLDSLRKILEQQLACLKKPILNNEQTDGIFKEIPKE